MVLHSRNPRSLGLRLEACEFKASVELHSKFLVNLEYNIMALTTKTLRGSGVWCQYPEQSNESHTRSGLHSTAQSFFILPKTGRN